MPRKFGGGNPPVCVHSRSDGARNNHAGSSEEVPRFRGMQVLSPAAQPAHLPIAEAGAHSLQSREPRVFQPFVTQYGGYSRLTSRALNHSDSFCLTEYTRNVLLRHI